MLNSAYPDSGRELKTCHPIRPTGASSGSRPRSGACHSRDCRDSNEPARRPDSARSHPPAQSSLRAGQESSSAAKRSLLVCIVADCGSSPSEKASHESVYQSIGWPKHSSRLHARSSAQASSRKPDQPTRSLRRARFGCLRPVQQRMRAGPSLRGSTESARPTNESKADPAPEFHRSEHPHRRCGHAAQQGRLQAACIQTGGVGKQALLHLLQARRSSPRSALIDARA